MEKFKVIKIKHENDMIYAEILDNKSKIIIKKLSQPFNAKYCFYSKGRKIKRLLKKIICNTFNTLLNLYIFISKNLNIVLNYIGLIISIYNFNYALNKWR